MNRIYRDAPDGAPSVKKRIRIKLVRSASSAISAGAAEAITTT